MCSFRWVLGASTERGALIMGADEVFKASCALGVDWMLANMESLRERYGEPKVRGLLRLLSRGVQSCKSAEEQSAEPQAGQLSVVDKSTGVNWSPP